MGFGRKVGAFLGLVPEDGRRDGFDHYSGEYGQYEGEYGRDYGAEHNNYGAEHNNYAAEHDYSPSYAPDYPDRYPARADDPADRYQARPTDSFSPEPLTQGALAMQPRVDVRRDTDSKTMTRPVTIKLTGFAEARVIGEKYREGLSVIMDMTEMSDSDARRLVDFAAGLAFAMRGSIDKVTQKVFMLLPSDVDAADLELDQRRELAASRR
jgi:cell division inhibitor SepF